MQAVPKLQLARILTCQHSILPKSSLAKILPTIWRSPKIPIKPKKTKKNKKNKKKNKKNKKNKKKQKKIKNYKKTKN